MAEEPRNRRLSPLDLKRSAEYVLDEAQRRRGRRRDFERKWKEIDRQLAMDPVTKRTADGRAVEGTEWMPQLELPLQAETHEMLTADVRRLMFPDDRNFFAARVLMDDANLERLVSRPIIAGLDDGMEAFLRDIGKKEIDQEFLDEMNAAVLRHFHRAYGMRDKWDLVNGEAMKYSTGIARAIRATVPVTFNSDAGVHRTRKRIPVLVPRPLKNVYLDDSKHAVLNQGMLVEPSVIEWTWHRLIELQKAAKIGSGSFSDENGGWMKARIGRIEASRRADEHIDLLEFEGDLLIPRSQGRNIDLPNVLATVLVGRGGPDIVRLRSREFPWRSYVITHYHHDKIDSAYGTSPLMIGSPIHKAATEALSRMLQAAALNTEPPVRYDPSDYHLAAQGGPDISPRARWQTQVGKGSTVLAY